MFKIYGKWSDVAAFVKGVTAADTEAIGDAVIVLGRCAAVAIPTAVLMPSTLVLVWKVKKLPEPVLVLGTAVIGLILYSLVGHVP